MISKSIERDILSRYTSRQRALESCVLLLFVICTLFFARNLYEHLQPTHTILLFLGLATGIAAADIVAGTVHWAADTWGTVEWPVIGPTLIRSFREHHIDPAAITRHDFVETNGASSMVSLPILVAGLYLPLDSTGNITLASFLLFFCIFILLTNQIHKWSHQSQTPNIVSFLQNIGLIMSSAHHKIHHNHPFDQQYCITTGWMNPLLTKIGYFRFLERLISKLSGAQPRADDMRFINDTLQK